jgi:carboxyl-terminal processing protease
MQTTQKEERHVLYLVSRILYLPGMHRALRMVTFVVLPIITLLLGWQLGATYEQREVREVEQHLEFLFSGQTESGTLLADPEKEVNLALLWGVWRLLQKHYIAPERMQTRDMLFGAVAGLTGAIGDPYTVFMTPSENDDFHSSLQGKLEGIGAELTLRDGRVVVVAPLKGSPASAAGLEPEDVIWKVDDMDMTGKSLAQVVERIRGPKGTTVTLIVERSGEADPLTITIVRDEIRVPSVEWEVKKTATGSVGYIALNQFGDESVREVREALKDLRSQEMKGLIFDMRFNGGGYLEGAVNLASLFLRQGKVVSVQRRSGEPIHHYVSGRPTDPEIPLVVLINEGSASAAEILAGAFQDHKRATIIGKKSFGKGTVQEVFDLPGGSSVRITTAKWLTPGGKDLSSEGVMPDIEVERTREDIENKRDPQLDAAIEWLVDGEDMTGARDE